MNDKIDLTGLLPDFASVGFFLPETAEQLSAIFVSALLVVFLGFLLVSIYALLASLRRTGWVSRLIKKETPSSAVVNRQELIEKARKVRHLGGHLWREFDETLIEVEQDGNVLLYNTVDANHFFNNSTLAAGITESRMLAAVPGFLTAFGVIGTFVGLQLGLSELNIGNDVAVSEMKTGLAHVISGAKIAFMTSVWGVTLSVLFNFIEKGLERIARSRISGLQNRIDQLFPRLAAELQLQRIADDGQQSRESLQGLAEKIGEKMQESLLEVSSGIQAGLESSLEKIMAPAINKLVDETSEGNQKALESLVDNFLTRFGELGDNQRDAMDTASQNVSDALGSLNSSMDGFLGKLEISQDKSTERDQHRQEVFIEQTGAMKSSTEALLSRVEEGLEKQLSASYSLIEQGKLLQAGIDKSVNANVEASTSMKMSANELKSASEEMKVFGSHIKDAGNSISGAVTNAVESTADLAQQNQLVSELMEKQMQQLADDRQQFMQAVERLQSLMNTADSSFDRMKEHQNEFLNNLKNNVGELADQMTNLLSDYASQANSQTERHLGVWAEHTTNYAQQMNNAAQALASVVDEIEVKLGK